MHKKKCQVCPYIYNPSEHGGEELPHDFVCPICGAGADKFDTIHHHGEEDTGGEAQEKHIPVISGVDKGVKVVIGSILHPMEEAHYITSVLLYKGAELLKKIELSAGQAPEAFFEGVSMSDDLMVLAHCNLHGIWESDKNL